MLLSGGPELPRVIDTSPVFGTRGREGYFFGQQRLRGIIGGRVR